MKRFYRKSAAARLAVSLMFAWLLAMMVGTGPVGAQDASPVVQVSVVAPSVTPEAIVVEQAAQAEVLTVNGVTLQSGDPDFDESGWPECRQSSGTQDLCQGRVERKLTRLGFSLPNWTNPDGAVTYMAGLFYENRPNKHVVSDCTRQMAAKWDKGTCWVHPATPTPPPATATPTETPEPTQTPTATNTSTPAPTATGTLLPTVTATSTAMPTATATASATSQVPTVTPTRGNPWVGHSLTLGSFCAPGADDPIGQAPGKALSAYIGAFNGTTNSIDGDWWGGDNDFAGWTQTTVLVYGPSPRVWSYDTSADEGIDGQPLMGWYFIDPATGLVAQRAAEPEIGFHMGGTRDSKWLASLHDCQPAVPTGTPPPVPAGEQVAALRGNGGGRVDPRGIALGVLVFIAGGLTALIILVVAAMVAAKRRDNASQQQD